MKGMSLYLYVSGGQMNEGVMYIQSLFQFFLAQSHPEQKVIALKRYGLPKICPPKKKSYVLFNEAGKKLNNNRGLQYFFVTHKYIPVKN